jgi:predicted DNA-binding transcriptional regulator AlpA
MKQKTIDELLDRMAANWPSEFIARKKIEEFSGGLMSGKTVANYETRKDGPPKVKLGRLAGYPKQEFVNWLKKHIVPAAR